MSNGSLSSRVKNMKFMQSAGDKQRKQEIDSAEKDETKKLKDLSEWSLPVNKKTLRVIKSKSNKIKKVGYSTINAMGPVIISQNLSDGTLGRMTLSKKTEDQKPEINGVTEENEEIFNDDEESTKSEKKKSKKSKKSKKKSKLMDDFKATSDDDFDPTEVDVTSKSLLELWKAKKK
ncbi:hypothetical protein C6P40_000306 [Pichia californica]|uniref:Uncharacterized protein n=1 Tax=Pichia californica TaxID=460514 RepID=A0A9P7BH25_9ASCO|nr:hypothetical protein C6P42_000391 [[Candida] californica]KAG0688968.1 hypothetical protein C6P40_000306 [[Candida] californica]